MCFLILHSNPFLISGATFSECMNIYFQMIISFWTALCHAQKSLVHPGMMVDPLYSNPRCFSVRLKLGNIYPIIGIVDLSKISRAALKKHQKWWVHSWGLKCTWGFCLCYALHSILIICLPHKLDHLSLTMFRFYLITRSDRIVFDWCASNYFWFSGGQRGVLQFRFWMHASCIFGLFTLQAFFFFDW